jgi:hypothetical protein
MPEVKPIAPAVGGLRGTLKNQPQMTSGRFPRIKTANEIKKQIEGS